MLEFNRMDLLTHPLSLKYLHMKWLSYGLYVHMLNSLLYAIYLVFITVYSVGLIDTNACASPPYQAPTANGTHTAGVEQTVSTPK